MRCHVILDAWPRELDWELIAITVKGLNPGESMLWFESMSDRPGL